MTSTDPALRPFVASLLVGAVCALVAFAAPLRTSGGDTVPGRFGAAIFACRNTLDLRQVDWIAADDAANSLPYYAAHGRGGAVISVFGPVPAIMGAPFMEALEEGTILMDSDLERLARRASVLAVALSATLLSAALAARTTAFRAAALALVTGLSFAGVATLAQGLWQQTALVVPLMAAVATVAWARWRGGALLALTPALLSVAVLIRPSSVFLIVAVGIAWWLAVSATPRRAALLGAALPLALFGALPQLAWNRAATGDPLALHAYVAGHTGGAGVGGGRVFTTGVGAFASGFVGLVASPARGLLFFAPVVLVALYVSLRHGQREARVLAFGVLLHMTLIAAYHQWWGGWVLGPRMLAETVWLFPLLVTAMPPSRTVRGVLVGTCVATVAVGILGAFRYQVGLWDLRRDPDEHHDALWDVKDSPLMAMVRDRATPTIDAPQGPYAYCAVERALQRVRRVYP